MIDGLTYYVNYQIVKGFLAIMSNSQSVISNFKRDPNQSYDDVQSMSLKLLQKVSKSYTSFLHHRYIEEY